MVAGIIGGIVGVVGLVLGIISLKKYGKSGMAIAGVIMCAISVLLGVAWIVLEGVIMIAEESIMQWLEDFYAENPYLPDNSIGEDNI